MQFGMESLAPCCFLLYPFLKKFQSGFGRTKTPQLNSHKKYSTEIEPSNNGTPKNLLDTWICPIVETLQRNTTNGVMKERVDPAVYIDLPSY